MFETMGETSGVMWRFVVVSCCHVKYYRRMRVVWVVEGGKKQFGMGEMNERLSCFLAQIFITIMPFCFALLFFSSRFFSDRLAIFLFCMPKTIMMTITTTTAAVVESATPTKVATENVYFEVNMPTGRIIQHHPRHCYYYHCQHPAQECYQQIKTQCCNSLRLRRTMLLSVKRIFHKRNMR